MNRTRFRPVWLTRAGPGARASTTTRPRSSATSARGATACVATPCSTPVARPGALAARPTYEQEAWPIVGETERTIH